MALNRREFLKWLSAGAGAGALAGCETPGADRRGAARARARRRHRRRLRRRDGGEVREDVGAGHRRRAGRARRAFHLVPAQQSRARRQHDDAGDHDGPRRACARAACASCATKPSRSIRQKREVRLARGASLPYDRLIVSPGVDFIYDKIPGLAQRRSAASACCTRGKRASRRSRCASSSKRCATAASTCCTSRSRRTAARRARTSACARSPITSSARSRSRRSSCSTRIPTSRRRRGSSAPSGTARTRA